MPWAKTMLGLFCSGIVISSNEMTNLRYYLNVLANIPHILFVDCSLSRSITCVLLTLIALILTISAIAFARCQLAHAQAGGIDSDSETLSFENWNDASGSRFSWDGVVRADRRTRLAERGRSSIGLPKATVSRRLAGLERSIGTALLKRSSRALSLTEPGRRYFERVQLIVREAEAAQSEIETANSVPSGT